jgi:hypothetical protein
MDTKFRKFFLGLSLQEQDAYAKRAGTTVNYIRTHLVYVPPRKTPRPPLLRALAYASSGRLSLDDVLEHFYQYLKEEQLRKDQAA